MKFTLALISPVLAVTGLLAFDSGKWLAERGDDSDMLRLQSEYAKCVKNIEVPAENVALPLEYYTNGVVKSRLKARKACLLYTSPSPRD